MFEEGQRVLVNSPYGTYRPIHGERGTFVRYLDFDSKREWAAVRFDSDSERVIHVWAWILEPEPKAEG